MPATAVKSKRVKGDGRVISVNAKYGFLAAQGINSKVFIIPSSLKIDAPFPALTDELHIDDLVTFEANEQAERNGAKYLAVDGSVKLKQRGRDVMVEGDGKIVRLDAVRGCFGFIESTKVGSVFFNISAVRPNASDVAKVLKLGQKVKFRALPNSEQPNCKWRASVVCPFGKANEFFYGSNQKLGVVPTLATPTMAQQTACGIKNVKTGVNADHQGQKKSPGRSGSVDHGRQSVSKTCRSVSSSFHASSENLIAADGCPGPSYQQHPTDPFSDPLSHNGVIGCRKSNGVLSSAYNSKADSCSTPVAAVSSFYNKNGRLTPTTAVDGSSTSPSPANVAEFDGNSSKFNGNFLCNPSLNGSAGYSNFDPLGFSSPQAVLNGGACSSGVKQSGWPSRHGVEVGVNPAALWDSYLEQQQKALSQTFNPFAAPPVTEIFPFLPQHQQHVDFSTTNGKIYSQHPFLRDTCDLSADFNGQAMDDNEVFAPIKNLLHCHSNAATNRQQTTLFYDQSPDDICRHIKKLAHQLNGWPGGDKCAYCMNEEK